jgi:rod shape-determining protein MreC
MESFLSRYRNSLVLALVLFVQVLGLAMQIKRQGEDGEMKLLRFWAVAAIAPIEKGVVHSQNWAHSSWTNYVNVGEVRRQNESLREQVEQLRMEQVRLREDANQARRIQSLLAFKEQFISKTIAAQVIGTSGSELSRIIYIDRGSNDGIKPNMPVITPEGIVGKVLRVYGSTAQVLEINDQTSGVGAILVNARLQGILKGSPNGDITLNYVMADEKVAAGDQVVTSGGDRIFPKGLPIGTIDSVSLGRDSFLNLRLKPSANLNRLEEVLVITDIELKEPDTKDLGPIRAADILAERLPSVPPKPDPTAAGTQSGQAPAGTTTGATPSTGGTTAQPQAQPAATAPTGVKPPAQKPSTGQGTTAANSGGAPATKPPVNTAETKPKPAAGSGSQASAKPATTDPAAKPKTTKPDSPKPASETGTPQGH